MKDRELLMRSVVNLMLAVIRGVFWFKDVIRNICCEPGYRSVFCAELPKLVA